MHVEGEEAAGRPCPLGSTAYITISLYCITISLQSHKANGRESMLVPAFASPFCFVKVNASAGTNTYKAQCCEARFFLTTSRGRGHKTLEANSHWPARVPETQQGSKPAQTREQGVTSWRTGGHEGLGVHAERRPWRCEGGESRGQLSGTRSDEHHSHPTLRKNRGVWSRNPGGGGETLENITFSVVLSTLVQVTHILPKVSGCQ